MAVDLLNTGEQFHANSLITPDPNTVKARIQDVFPVCGAFHEGLVNIRRGWKVDASCQVFTCRDPGPSPLLENTLADRSPRPGFLPVLRVFVVKIALALPFAWRVG